MLSIPPTSGAWDLHQNRKLGGRREHTFLGNSRPSKLYYTRTEPTDFETSCIYIYTYFLYRENARWNWSDFDWKWTRLLRWLDKNIWQPDNQVASRASFQFWNYYYDCNVMLKCIDFFGKIKWKWKKIFRCSLLDISGIINIVKRKKFL